jgi:signal transduction histidine kinase
VRTNVEKITRLSLDLLNFAKSPQASFREKDPNQPAREVYELMLQSARQAGVTLHLDPDLSLPRLYLDPEGIHRCLLNLVTNAIEACAENGCAKENRTVRLRTRGEKGWGAVYQVSDTCGGMPPQIREKIFKTFFTTKGTRGTGIGLMLTKKIVDQHRGHLEVVSHVDQGSTFTLKIPADLSPSSHT